MIVILRLKNFSDQSRIFLDFAMLPAAGIMLTPATVSKKAGEM